MSKAHIAKNVAIIVGKEAAITVTSTALAVAGFGIGVVVLKKARELRAAKNDETPES